MHISIADSSEQPIQENFFFEPIPNKLLEEKEYKEITTKWYLFPYAGDSSLLFKSDHSGSTNPSNKPKPNPFSRISSPILMLDSSTIKSFPTLFQI